MKLTDELLLKYADGNLDSDAISRIEHLLEADADAREILRLIRVSGDALAGENRSFQEQSEPDQLARRILSGELDEPASKASLKAVRSSSNDPGSRFGSSWRPQHAAALFGFLAIGLAAGFFGSTWVSPRVSSELAAYPTWLVRVVDYHTLYGRETVESSRADAQEVSRLERRFAAMLNRPVFIPDLKTKQLEFRRGQVLKFGNEVIIQLAYLPEQEGQPVALCLKLSVGHDMAPSFAKLRGLGVVRWRQNNIEYVLVGDHAASRLRIAADYASGQIAERHGS